MTLDLISRRIQYVGNDTTKCFSFPFRAWDTSQIHVYCFNENESWTEIDITNRVTVTLNNDSDGGYVTFNSAPANGLNFAIVREMPFIQEDEYISGARFDAHEVEDRFDMDAAERQELLDGLNRAILVPNSSTQNPQNVYCTLICGAQTVEGYLDSLTTLYNCALYYYNIAIGILTDTTYQATHQTCFTMDSTCLNEFVYEFKDGFSYYPQTHQLLVSVDGTVLTEGCQYNDVGEYGCESQCIRFCTPLYEGQEVYIKAGFLGTQEFDLKIQCFIDEGDCYYKCFKELYDCFEEQSQEFCEQYNCFCEQYNCFTKQYNCFKGQYNSSEGQYYMPQSCLITIESNNKNTNNCCTICHNIPYQSLDDLTISVDGLIVDKCFLEIPNSSSEEDNTEDSNEGTEGGEGEKEEGTSELLTNNVEKNSEDEEDENEDESNNEDNENDDKDLHTSTIIKLPLYPGQKVYIQRGGVFYATTENNEDTEGEEGEGEKENDNEDNNTNGENL